MSKLSVTIEMIRAAAERLAPHLVTTPVLEHPALNKQVRGRVFLKCENLQRVGAFKFRGAYNKISQVDPKAYPGGVVASSSGNHAQGVAAAATLCGLKSAIVMPKDAPPIKVARTKAFGGEVVPYDREREDRDAIARKLCEERKAIFVPPFDDPDVIAGQGTAGLELMAEAARRGVKLDAVLINVSGGGLASGIAVAVKDASPATDVWTVEPAGFDDFARSLASGKPEKNSRLSGSICDALMAESPGKHTLAIGSALMKGGVSVTDDEVRDAMRFAFEELKLVAEPGGAASLAAILTGKVPVEGRAVAALISGGNADPAQFAKIITRAV
jgi:threonine dehydratase